MLKPPDGLSADDLAAALPEHWRLDVEPVVRVNERFGAALYPYVSGDSFTWGHALPPAYRDAVLEMIIAVHTAPRAVAVHAPVDDFAVAHRADLEAACDPARAFEDCGPYAVRTTRLLTEHSAAVQQLLKRYDELVRAVRPYVERHVLTHGEPHPGNTMRTAEGWRLIDWDTALVAQPERDLWALEPGDGSILETYAATTGVTPSPTALDLYRLRWDIADMAVVVAGFRRPHAGTADDDASWDVLRRIVEGLSARG
jgi:aminoglycoside phosphotransferase (APT) family kinase protein